MANNIIKRVWNQNKMVSIEALQGMAFQAEDGGHTFEISGVDDSGNPVALSGTVAGVFVRPDNADIALSGTASDGKVYVTLSDACYTVPGKFGLTIFVTADSKKTAVYAAIGTVNRTSGGAVAGDTPQDVVDLINAINAAIESIPASYTNVLAAVAPTYSNTNTYAVGSYAWYNGVLYRAGVDITTAESWTAAHWVQVDIGSDLLSSFSAAFDTESDIYKELTELADVSVLTWEVGSISASTGADQSSTTRIRSSSILVKRGSVVSVPIGYKIGVYMYSVYKATTASYLGNKSVADKNTKYIVPRDCYIRIVLGKADDSTLSDTTIKSVLSATIYKPIVEDIPTTYPLMRQYYNTGGTSTFDINTNTAISTENLFSTAVVEVNAGEQYLIEGAGGETARLYAWYDSSGDLIDRATASFVVVGGALLTAPSGAKKLVMNSINAALSIGKVVPFRSKTKVQSVGQKRLVEGVIMNASFYGTTGSTPKLTYEDGCRTFGFHIKDGCKYTVKVINGTSLRIGLLHDNITIKGSNPTDGSESINLKGYLQFTDNPFTFQTNGYRTAFLYGSSNTVTADCDFIVYEEENAADWSAEVSVDAANEKNNLLSPPLFGSPAFYLSDVTGDSHVSLNGKSVAEYYALWDDMCTNYPHMMRRGTDLGYDATNTYVLREYIMSLEDPLVSVGEIASNVDSIDLTTVTNLWKSSMRNNVLAVSAGMHGKEKSPAWGLALAFQDILASDEPWAQFIKSNFEVHIAPCLNPYGFQANIRDNGNGVDINRDFFAYSQVETQEFRDWLTALAPRTVAYIDSHGTAGHYAYWESGGDSKYFNGYCNAMLRFTSAIQNAWKAFYAPYSLDPYPYCFMARSTFQGTKRVLMNQLGILGLTIETPQDFRNYGNYTTNLDNDIRACKLTKDMIINLMQLFGEWGYRIKNFGKTPFSAS